MVITPAKEYNITDTHTNKQKRASVAHEFNKKSNVVGKKYTNKRGWEPIKEEPPTFKVCAGSAPRLCDMARDNGGEK